MRIDFYHIDKMEVANYLPLWRALVRLGADARLVTAPPDINTGGKGWFDFEATVEEYRRLGVPNVLTPDYDSDLAITTQYPTIVAPYRKLKAQMMYGPSMMSDNFLYLEKAVWEFDAILAHGEYSRPRLRRWTRDDQILIMGFPKYDAFFRKELDAEATRRRLGLTPGKKVIVYLPTWDKTSSIDAFAAAVGALSDVYETIVKPHHCTARFEPGRMAALARSGARALSPGEDLPELLNVADLALCDIGSGSLYEAIVCDRPAIAFGVDPEHVNLCLDPEALKAFPLFYSPDGLRDAVEAALKDGGERAEARRALADSLVAYRDGSAATKAATAVLDFVNRRSRVEITVRETAEKPKTIPRRPRNVYWFCLDGLRPDKLAAFGCPQAADLFLDRATRRGFLFKNVVTAAGSTRPATHAALTGLYGASNGVNGYEAKCLRNMDPRALTLADHFKRAGYTAFRYHDMFSSSQPKSGFDVYTDGGVNALLETPNRSFDTPARDHFLSLMSQTPGPKFMYMHVCLMHDLGTINGGPVWTTEMYQKIIPPLSDDLATLLKKLRWTSDDILVLSSDHGIDLDVNRRDDIRANGLRLDEGHMRVFCAFIGDDIPRGVNEKIVRTIDIAPTLMDLTGLGDMGAQGESLVPYMEGEAPPPRVALMERESDYEVIPHSLAPCVWGARTDEWKYVVHKWRKENEWLMNVARDGDYRTNLLGQGLPIENELRTLVRETLIDNPPKPADIYRKNGLKFSREDIHPIVTILLPLEKPCHALNDRIWSLLDQRGPYRELIVLDAVASDYNETRFRKEYDDRPHVYYYREESAPLGELLNRGIARARGEYIAIVSPNAVYSDWFLFKLKCLLDRDPNACRAVSSYGFGPFARFRKAGFFDDSAIVPGDYLAFCGLWRAALFKACGSFPVVDRPIEAFLKKIPAGLKTAVLDESRATFHGLSPTSIPKEKPAAPAATPRVSVVLPTFNDLTFLPRAIHSVVKQRYRDFELIIVNDGSEDGTYEYLECLNDPRIRVIHQENKRLPEALNAGFQAARGELLTWTSSDNYCSPVFLEALVAALDAFPQCGFAYSAYMDVNEYGTILGKRENQNVRYHHMLPLNAGGLASFMYRRECQDAVGLYDPAVEGAEDWDMWLRIVEKFEAVYVPDILYYYTYHPRSMTSTMKDKIRRSARKVFSNAIARRGGQFDILEMYPDIERCQDPKAAAAWAFFDFGAACLKSMSPPIKYTCQALENALRINPAFWQAAADLAIAYGRSGQWEKCERLVSRIEQINHPQVQTLCRQLREAKAGDNSDALNNVLILFPDKREIELFQLEKERENVFSYAERATRAGAANKP